MNDNFEKPVSSDIASKSGREVTLAATPKCSQQGGTNITGLHWHEQLTAQGQARVVCEEG